MRVQAAHAARPVRQPGEPMQHASIGVQLTRMSTIHPQAAHTHAKAALTTLSRRTKRQARLTPPPRASIRTLPFTRSLPPHLPIPPQLLVFSAMSICPTNYYRVSVTSEGGDLQRPPAADADAFLFVVVPLVAALVLWMARILEIAIIRCAWSFRSLACFVSLSLSHILARTLSLSLSLWCLHSMLRVLPALSRCIRHIRYSAVAPPPPPNMRSHTHPPPLANGHSPRA